LRSLYVQKDISPKKFSGEGGKITGRKKKTATLQGPDPGIHVMRRNSQKSQTRQKKKG